MRLYKNGEPDVYRSVVEILGPCHAAQDAGRVIDETDATTPGGVRVDAGPVLLDAYREYRERTGWCPRIAANYDGADEIARGLIPAH